MAGASTPIGVSASLAATPNTSLGTAGTNTSGVAGSAINIAVTGTTGPSDSIVLTLACAAAGTQSFASSTSADGGNNNVVTSPNVTVTVGTSTRSLMATTNSNNACGAGVQDELEITDPFSATTPSTTGGSISVTPYYVLSGVPSGSVGLSGSYVSTAPAISFGVPSDLTVNNVTVTPTTPVTVVPPGTGDAAIGNLTVTMPSLTAVPANAYVCLTLATPSSSTPGASGWDTIGGTPTVTQVNASASNETLTSTATAPSGTNGPVTVIAANGSPVLSFQLSPTGLGSGTQNPPVYQLAGLHVDVPSTTSPSGNATGSADVSVSYGTNPNCTTGTTSLIGGQVAFIVGTPSGAAIYGTSAEGTAAAEFEKAFVSTVGSTASCTNNNVAILATAADPYDALSASYLEGQFHTGVLITPVSVTGAIDPNTLAALKIAGVQRVYVVGGPLAVTPQEISTLQATPAYNCGGLTPTGGDIQVVQAATTGQTALDTAVLIDNYVSGNGQGQLPVSLSSAFSSASTYNQTTGNASTAAPTTANGTALVVSSTDWQDADAIAGIAWQYKLPVILTSATSLSTQAQTELVKLGYDQVIVLGGQLAVTPAVVSAIQGINVVVNGVSTPISVLRIAGQTATQTSADIAMFTGKVLSWANQTLYVAQGTTQGTGWGDSLAAAPLSGSSSGSLLLTAGPIQALPSTLTSALTMAGTPPSGLGGGVTTNIQVLGGPLAVTTAQITQMQAALGAG